MADSDTECTNSQVITDSVVEERADDEEAGTMATSEKDANNYEAILRALKDEAKKTKRTVALVSNLLLIFGVILGISLTIIFLVSWRLRPESCVSFSFVALFSIIAGVGIKRVYLGNKLPGYKIRMSGAVKPRFVFRRKTEAEMRRTIPRGLLFGLGVLLFVCSLSIIAGESGNLSLYYDDSYYDYMDWEYTGLSTISALASLAAMTLATMTSRKSAIVAAILSLSSTAVQIYLIVEADWSARHYNYITDNNKTPDSDIWKYFGTDNGTILPYPFAWSAVFVNMQFMPLVTAGAASVVLFLLSICSMFYLNIGVTEDGEEEANNGFEDISEEGKESSVMTTLAGLAFMGAAVITSSCAFVVYQSRIDRDWDKRQFVFFSWWICPFVYLMVGSFCFITKSKSGHRRSILFVLLLPLIVLTGFGLVWSANLYRDGMREEHSYLEKCSNGTDENFCAWTKVQHKEKVKKYHYNNNNNNNNNNNEDEYYYHDASKNVLDCIPRAKFCDGVVDMVGHAKNITLYYQCSYDGSMESYNEIRFPDETVCMRRWTPAFVMVFLGHCIAIVTALTVALQTCDEVPRSVSVLYAALKTTASYIVVDKDVSLSSNSGSEENVALT